MHTKLGVDIVHIPRFEKLMKNRTFINRVFQKSEISKTYDVEHFAGVFAAKEAFFKAVNKINPRWHDIEVQNKKDGRPELLISSNIRKLINEIDVSISHDGEYAIAVVICQMKNVR